MAELFSVEDLTAECEESAGGDEDEFDSLFNELCAEGGGNAISEMFSVSCADGGSGDNEFCDDIELEKAPGEQFKLNN